MSYDEVLKLIRQRPFRPLRFHFTNGETRDLRHPEMAVVERSMVFLFKPSSEMEGLAEDVGIYSLLHVVKIEPLRDGKEHPSTRHSA